MIFDIQRNSFVDGPGIRTTVFFKGCNLQCAWCHNPESQSPKKQLLYFKDKCFGCNRCKAACPHSFNYCTFCGACAALCPNDARELCGSECSADALVQEVLKDKRFYDHSDGGVTFSGGECMLQIDFLETILKKCKEHGLHTAIDTAGNVPFSYFERILPFTDLLLYDVKCFDSVKHKHYTGVGNELILENLSKLLQCGNDIWVRIPVIADINDSEQEMLAIKAFLDTYGTPKRIQLLPYHAMGMHKYAAIQKDAPSFSRPSDETIEHLQQLFA